MSIRLVLGDMKIIVKTFNLPGTKVNGKCKYPWLLVRTGDYYTYDCGKMSDAQFTYAGAQNPIIPTSRDKK